MKKELMKKDYKFSSRKYALILYSCLIVLLLTFSVIFYMRTFVLKSKSSLMYKESSKVDYTVNLKKNDYYESETLNSGMNYIANLIDSIDVVFDYNFISNEKLDYNVTYGVKAITRVYDDSDKKEILYEKSYNLVDSKNISKNELMHNDFKQNIKIDYQYYNSFVEAFKSSYALNSSSDITIILDVKTDAKSDKFKNKIDTTSTSSLVIPLTEQTINIKIDSNDINNYKTIEEDNGINGINIEYLVAFILSILSSLVFIYYLIRLVVLMLRERSKYDIKLKKILKDYDNIIGNAKNGVDTKGFKIFNMLSFEELRDIHDNLGTPIIYNEIKEHKLAEFIIIHDNIIYKYVLDEKNISGGKKNDKEKNK